MKDFLKKIFQKKSLRRSVLFLSLSGVVLTFLAMIIMSPLYLYLIERAITQRGNEWGEETANLAERLYHEQTKVHLREKVAAHSNLINKNLEKISDDVLDISSGMEEILKNKSMHRPRYLPDPSTRTNSSR